MHLNVWFNISTCIVLSKTCEMQDNLQAKKFYHSLYSLIFYYFP